MPLRLSRGEIITEGLSQVGRPDLVSEGRLWLNIFLERMYYNQDWEWLIKTLDSIPVTENRLLPDDYRSAKSASINVGTATETLPFIGPEEYDVRKNLINTTGKPQFLYIDHDTRTLHFLPAPSSNLTFNLKYYYLPDIPSHTIPENDDLIPKWDAPAVILINHIKEMAYEYNDDMRQDKQLAKTVASVGEAKMNQHDKRAGSHKLKLGKVFRDRFGRKQGKTYYGD